MPPASDLDPTDEAIVAGQLGRTPRDLIRIAVRCSYGCPAVIETRPVLSDGSPNPTLLYLTCPALAAAISAFEAGGGVRRFRERAVTEPDFKVTLDLLTAAYQARRSSLAGPEGEARPEAGIGGPSGPEKASCLHAYAAALLAAQRGALAMAAETKCAADRVRAEVFGEIAEPWCSDERCLSWRPQSPTATRVAVIDVGTVSVRLLVADVASGEIEDLARLAEVTRLGEGLTRGVRLSTEARRRTETVIQRFVATARQQEAARIVLVGTSACRDASDGEEFIQNLGRDLRIEARVLTGTEEAEYAYRGASLDVPGKPVVLDVGGGSSELIRQKATGMIDSVSLDLGASRATGRWITSDPPAGGEIDQISGEALGAFSPLAARFGAGSLAEAPTLVGVAGTVTTLACLQAGLTTYSREAIHL
jgi:exopolyphosphatase/guanosine-5'-triphosphate,3'-diphosphate pyrophosphatase